MMTCVGSSSRGVATMKIINTDLGPIEIIRYFGGVPIFRTQIVFKLKKVDSSECHDQLVAHGSGLRIFEATTPRVMHTLEI